MQWSKEESYPGTQASPRLCVCVSFLNYECLFLSSPQSLLALCSKVFTIQPRAGRYHPMPFFPVLSLLLQLPALLLILLYRTEPKSKPEKKASCYPLLLMGKAEKKCAPSMARELIAVLSKNKRTPK